MPTLPLNFCFGQLDSGPVVYVHYKPPCDGGRLQQGGHPDKGIIPWDCPSEAAEVVDMYRLVW